MAERVVEEVKTYSRTTERRRKRVYLGYDWSLLFLTLFFVCLGLVFVYSTSSYISAVEKGNDTYYLVRQAKFAGLGIVAMLITSFIPLSFYVEGPTVGGFKINLLAMFWLFCVILQFMVLAIGTEKYGAKRWIEIGGFSFQPSEFTKLCLILTCAFVASTIPKKINKFGGFFMYMLLTVPLIVLVLVQDFSTAIVMGGIVIIVCFVTSKNNLWVILTGIAAVAGGAVLVVFSDGFRKQRFDAWLNIDTAEDGQQIRRGLYAISSGGLFGKGLGESSMKLGYIPEAHNDMIFSVIVEEIGIFGAIAIILLYVFLLWRIGTVATNANTLYESLVCIGVMSHIAVQVIMNIAVVTNSIPATGIALPFISYGGTSVICLLIEIGLVLAVSRKIEITE